MILDFSRQEYAKHFDWFEGRMKSLFTGIAPDTINGLALIPAAKLSTEFNYFGAVSRFYSDAMLGDVPSVPGATLDLLETLTEHWSVTGEACIVGVPGQLRAVRPDYVYPIYDIYDREIVRRFLFVYPQRNPEFEHTVTNQVTYADRARVIDYSVATGLATQSVRDYRSGWVADSPIGENVAIGNVIWIRTRDGIYPQMQGIVREVTVRLNILQRFLNSISNSVLQIDTDAISGGEFTATGVTQAGVNAASDKGLGLTVTPPFQGEEGARFIERTGNGLEESLEYLRMLLGQLGVISGVPDYVFGVQLGRPADETERILFTGQSKVNRFRRNIERAFAMLNMPIRFGTTPFVTRNEMLSNLGKQLELGAITVNEYRRQTGYGPINGGSGLANRIRAMVGRGNNDND